MNSKTAKQGSTSGKHAPGSKNYHPKLNLDLGKLDPKYPHNLHHNPGVSSTISGSTNSSVTTKLKNIALPHPTNDHLTITRVQQQSSPKQHIIPVGSSGSHPSIQGHYHFEDERHSLESRAKMQALSQKHPDTKVNYVAQLHETLSRARIMENGKQKQGKTRPASSSPQNVLTKKSLKSKTPTSELFLHQKKQKTPEMSNFGPRGTPTTGSIRNPQMQASKHSAQRQKEHLSSPEYDSTARRSSNLVGENYSSDHLQHLQNEELHDFLANFTHNPKDHGQVLQRISVNSASNYPESNNSRERNTHPHLHEVTFHQFQEILRLLEDKNHEIQKLNREKKDLRNTLRVLAEDLTKIKKIQKIVKEKDQVINNLQESLNDALMESQELRRELKHSVNAAYSKDGSPSRERDSHQHQRQEGLDALADQLRKLADEDIEHDRPLDKKSTLLELLQKQNNLVQGGKRPDSNYMLSNLEYRTERNSNPVNVVSPSQLFHRNHSTTLEDHIKKKLSESPYYETLRNQSKKLATPKMLATKKIESKPSIKKVGSIGGKPGKPQISSTTFKRAELAETPTKRVVTALKNHDKFTPHVHHFPQSTPNAEFELTQRKFSHEPKLSLESQFTTKLKGRDTQGDTQPPRHEGEHSFDMAAALDSLKERIRRVLEKHRDYHLKLKRTNDIIMQKLEELGIIPDKELQIR